MNKEHKNTFLAGLKVLPLAAAVSIFAACDVEQVEEGEMPSVDVDTQGGEMPKVSVEKGRMPDVDVDADPGKLPEYDVDSKIHIGTRQETITVPEITWDEDHEAEEAAENRADAREQTADESRAVVRDR